METPSSVTPGNTIFSFKKLRMMLQSFWSRFCAVFGLLARSTLNRPKTSLLIIAMVLLGVLVFQDISSDEILLDSIEVPSSLQPRVSSIAITRQLVSDIISLRHATITSFHSYHNVVSSHDLPAITIKTGPFELSLAVLGDFFRALLRRPRARITGVALAESGIDNRLHLKIYMPAGTVIDCSAKIDLSEGLLDCAEKLSELTAPYPTSVYYFQNHRWDEAKNLTLKVMRSPSTEERKWAYSLYGQLCARRGDSELALANYETASKLDPSFAAPYVNMGNLALSSDPPNYQKAESLYRTALKVQPTNARAANNLGNLMETLGKSKEAEDLYNQSISFDRNLSDPYSGLGVLAAQRGDVGTAEMWFSHAAQLAVSKAEPYVRWGQVYFNLKQYAAAEVRFQWAVSADRFNKTAWVDLARAQALQNNFTGAEKSALNALPDIARSLAQSGKLNQNSLPAVAAADLIIRPYDFSDDAYAIKTYILIEAMKHNSGTSSSTPKVN